MVNLIQTSFSNEANLGPMELMKAAGLDFKVKKEEIIRKGSGTGRYWLVNEDTDKVLDEVATLGAAWTPTQNETAFGFFSEFVERGDMTMTKCGTLGKAGNVVYAHAKLNRPVTILGGDTIDGGFVFSNPHKYGRSVEVRNISERFVCTNQFNVNQLRVSVNHRGMFQSERVMDAIGLAVTALDRTKEVAEKLASKKYTEESMLEYFSRVFPITGTKEAAEAEAADVVRYADKKLSMNARRAVELVETQPGAEFAPGSYWNLYNAVTYLNNHVVGRNEGTRLNSLWFGAGRTSNDKALRLAQKMSA